MAEFDMDQPIRARRRSDFAELQARLLDECGATGDTLDELDDDAIDELAEWLGTDTQPLVLLQRARQSFAHSGKLWPIQ